MAMRLVYLGRIPHHLPALEQKDSIFAHFKVNIAIALVLHGTSEVRRSHNAMPSSIVLLVKFLSYVPCNILKKRNVSSFGSSQPINEAHNFTVLTYHITEVLYKSKCCTIHSIVLHFVRHFNISENGFEFRHLA
jgi:hypothetical protein